MVKKSGLVLQRLCDSFLQLLSSCMERAVKTGIRLPYFRCHVCLYLYGGIPRFRQPEIFHGYLLSNGKKADPKYARSSLREEQAKTYLEKLLEVMNTEKPYLDSELKIQQLADRAGVSSHHLSQIINEQLGQRYTPILSMATALTRLKNYCSRLPMSRKKY
jgi:AraC-like DNA-binding protein